MNMWRRRRCRFRLSSVIFFSRHGRPIPHRSPKNTPTTPIILLLLLLQQSQQQQQ